MIPEIGNFSLMLALVLALMLGVLPILGSLTGNQRLMDVAKPAVFGQMACVIIAFVTFAYSFIYYDFSVKFVAQHSNLLLPLEYRIAAVWGGHEGSLLLWMLMLAGWTTAVALFSKRLPQEMVARVLGVLGLVSAGFISFILFTSNPFERLLPAALDGFDLNPQLQDFGMIIHPPLLYMGYVGMSVAFAFAVAALIGGQLDAAWARWSRPWTTVAWMFLTLGIMLGSWWAYYELGWGGWWFWDPVENASFMPWLVGTALIHSLAVTEKRGAFKSWTVILAISAFSLSLLGTFLVRSGILTSVHSFASDPTRGLFILIYICVVVGGSLILFAWRAHKVGMGGGFEVVSRESMLLLNNVLLVAATGTVFLGTLYPLFLDALNLGKISVGPPYFEAVFAPVMMLAVFAMGFGPFARWKQDTLAQILKRVWPWLVASIALGLLISYLFGRWSAPIVAGVSLGMWAILSGLAYLIARVRELSGANGAWAKLRATSRATYGMLLAHAGMGVFVLGVTLVNGFQNETEVRMRTGDTATLDGYVFKFHGVREVQGPNYVAAQAKVTVTHGGDEVATLYPEKRKYTKQASAMTEGAIDSSLFRDVYLALGEQVGMDVWIMRILHKPMVYWIWGGAFLMALGGLLAICDRRYRLPLSSKSGASKSAPAKPAL